MVRRKIKVRRPLNKEKIVAISGPIVILFILVGLFFWKQGYFSFGEKQPKGYDEQVVSVTSEQGHIDWQELANKNSQLKVAYIKATEGSSYEDDRFENNWIASKGTRLQTGAFHYFSFDSSGATQADNFIQNVPIEEGRLNPVIVMEFYGDNEKTPIAKDIVLPELFQLIDRLESHYGQKVVLCVTEKIYAMYIQDDVDGHNIWMVDAVNKLDSIGEDLLYWQYTSEGRLKGTGDKVFPLSVIVH